jgi:hypothetical protein
MILLSFDLEEFDLPLEHHVNISSEEQLTYSLEGSRIILDLIEEYQIKATFFCTAVFAKHAKDLIHELINLGHEVASHGYRHSSIAEDDFKKSRQVLEKMTCRRVKGYRMAHMMKTDMQVLADAGYLYDSSLNPTFIPGRYNNVYVPRTCFYEKGILELPVSVSPLVRIPLFWLSMHNFPFPFYFFLCKQTLKHDGYLNIYFHSWEFSSHLHDKRLKIPFIIKRNSGIKLRYRLEHFIQLFIARGETFETISDFIIKNKLNNE